MKTNSILFVLLFAVGHLSFAQVEKGKRLVSANLNFSNQPDLATLSFSTANIAISDTTSISASSFSLNLTPRIGYVIMDQLVVGVDLGVGFNELRSTGLYDVMQRKYRFGAGLFARYYYPTKSIMPFIEASMYRVTEMSRITIVNNFNTVNQNFGIGLGLAWPLNDMLTFESHLKYLRIQYDAKSPNQVGQEHTIFLNLGFSVFMDKLRKRKAN